MISLAGGLAWHRYTGLGDASVNFAKIDPEDSDLIIALAALHDRYRDRFDHMLARRWRRLEERTNDLLDDYWDDIEAVADALLIKGSLGADDLAKLLG